MRSISALVVIDASWSSSADVMVAPLFLPGSREGDAHDRAAPDPVVDREVEPGRGGERAGHGQTEPEPWNLGLPPGEQLEHHLLDLVRDARTLVPHVDRTTVG